MGFYASGRGTIRFKRPLTSEEYVSLFDLLHNDFEIYISKVSSYLDIYDNGKYSEELIAEALEKVASGYPVLAGSIEYVGEDGPGSLWRFYYKDGSFVSEDGHVEYNDLNTDRVINAFRDYVMNDLSATDPAYVKEVLSDVCGLTDPELESLGFGFLVPDGDELAK